MAQHTPGPWHLGAKFVGTVDGYSVQGFPISAQGQSICRVHAGHILGFGNEDANARLIAAAPDLLAALKALLAYEDAEEGFFLSGDTEAARAAITKAEG